MRGLEHTHLLRKDKIGACRLNCATQGLVL